MGGGILSIASAEPASSAQGFSGFGTWTQLGQAIVALLNLLVVVYLFVRTRRDKQQEQRLSVDSFWLQKVIVEPQTKAVDELCAALEEHLLKAQSAGRETQGANLSRVDEAIASYSDAASRRLEKFVLQVLPILRVVVDHGCSETEKPSARVERVVDDLDDAVTVAIARVFDDPEASIEPELEKVRKSRFDFFRVLFLLHRRPFEKEGC